MGLLFELEEGDAQPSLTRLPETRGHVGGGQEPPPPPRREPAEGLRGCKSPPPLRGRPLSPRGNRELSEPAPWCSRTNSHYLLILSVTQRSPIRRSLSPDRGLVPGHFITQVALWTRTVATATEQEGFRSPKRRDQLKVSGKVKTERCPDDG